MGNVLLIYGPQTKVKFKIVGHGNRFTLLGNLRCFSPRMPNPLIHPRSEPLNEPCDDLYWFKGGTGWAPFETL